LEKDNSALSYLSAAHCMQQLYSSGVRTLVASPGLRNSPLLLAAHRTSGLKVITAVDERGGGFLALGICRGSDAPVALLCTSGTAVANYFPAVMEANHSQLPLVVLTADRPTELVGTGANQCTDLTKVFGSHVRFSAEIGPAIEANFNQGKYVIARAVARSERPVPGPIHVNLRFREPFLPERGGLPDLLIEKMNWKFLSAESHPSAEQLEAIHSLVQAAERPAIVLGPAQLAERDALALAKFSEAARIPILAEAASGISFHGEFSSSLTLQRSEALLEKMLAGKIPAPDLILRFGEPVTGRGLGNLLKQAPIAQLVFEDWGEAREPNLHPSIFVEGGFSAWIQALAERQWKRTEFSWSGELLKADAAIDSALAAHLEDSKAFTEWHFHRAFAEKVGAGASLFLGNSMPIRDFNSVFPKTNKRLRVFANRGLSGIDGLIASAAGIAHSTKAETHAVIGDLSALHDLSSLSLLRSLGPDLRLTIWVMNNGGGEIFRIVPTAKTEGQLEWFTTPQEYDLSALAKAFQIPFTLVRSLADLADLPNGGFESPGVRIVEVLVQSEKNLEVRKAFRP
jgi:2-succinyl-5-enolpyruvyl-6-hydroxy-3-cyclohexene-1-carboxylate synthase